MPNFQPINRERHTRLRWKRPTNHLFAAAEGFVRLAVNELPQALHAMPIVFLAAEGGYIPVGLLGLRPDQNLFVARNGRWVAAYVPAAYRNYPFSLAKTPEGKPVLCVDEDSGLISENEGDVFMQADGTPGKALGEVFQQLNEMATRLEHARLVCATLTKHQLIQPLVLKLQGDKDQQQVEGLFRIDETALNKLPADAFMELREKGALLTAYCQLLSMQHLQNTLPQLAAVQNQPSPTLPTKKGELDLSFLENKDTLKFF